MTTDTDLADWERALLRDDATERARQMVARPVAAAAQCADCWKVRPLRPWKLGRRRDLCTRCWRKAQNAITVRTWCRNAVRVATAHPVHGELHRGTVTLVHQDGGWRMAWQIADQDGTDLGGHVGDFADAEARLLEATAWADEIDADKRNDEED